MAETTSIHIRWPNELAARVRAIADKRHTTMSELTRQAVIDKYALASADHDAVDNETAEITMGSKE